MISLSEKFITIRDARPRYVYSAASLKPSLARSPPRAAESLSKSHSYRASNARDYDGNASREKKRKRKCGKKRKRENEAKNARGRQSCGEISLVRLWTAIFLYFNSKYLSIRIFKVCHKMLRKLYLFLSAFFFHGRSVLVKLSIRTRDRFDGPVRRDATRGVSGFQTWNNRCANLSRRPVSPQGRRRPSRPLCIDTPIESEPHATNLFPRIVPSSRRAARCARERAFTCMRAGARERSYYASLIRKKG